MPKSLKEFRSYLFAFLVIGAPLSFIPSIATPALDFPSLRLGLYQIIAGFFVAITIVPLYKDLYKLFGLNKIAYSSLATLALVVMTSLLFSSNQNRGALLSASVMFLILFLLTSWWYVQFQIKKVPKMFLQIFLLSGVVVAILAILQLAWGTYADSGAFLCKGCVSDIFGFPRINVTAAEPLFLANALLPVLIVSFYLFFKNYKFASISLFATTFTIVLTFARGGYLAAVAGILTVAIALYVGKRTSVRQILHGFGIIFAAGILSLLFLLTSATVRFYSTTPNITYITMQSMVEHLSLGIIRLPDRQITSITNNNPSDDFQPPGLIESSTNERLDSAELAIKAWADNPKNIIMGTGLGNLGPYVVSKINPIAPSNLTVYIFYVLILAELGIIGLASLLILIASIIVRLIQNLQTKPIHIFGLGLVVSFAIQYIFFGSYINVVYVWLWLGIILGILSNNNLTFQGIINRGKRRR